MKDQLKELIESALASLIAQQSLPADVSSADVQLERTKDRSHGDFASNIAMVLAKPAKMNPRQIATLIVDALPQHEMIEKVEIAGPGFINFSLSASSRQQVVADVLKKAGQFGLSNYGNGQKVQVEFVSANPTGPLHVGHGRGAAYGSVVSSLLKAVGFDVHREYYVNDAGRQMDILATSVWLRYLEKCGEQFTFPSNGYRGEYVLDIAETLKQQHGNALLHSASQAFNGVPADEPQGGDKELHIDGLTQQAKNLLGADVYRQLFDLGLNAILDDIRNDLAGFGAEYDEWFSERSLVESGVVDEAVEQLKAANMLYQQDGAWWFKSTDFGDKKDRVVVRDNGQATYFASDVAYHLNKFNRGFDQIIDIWGADHHGYITRVKASMEALNQDVSKLKVLLVQFAVLYRGKEKVGMSTRSGEFVTLRELRDEVGKDAARFFYVMRGADQHMDFDLELAKSQSNDNPVYYVQYAHARVCSVFRQLAERQLNWDEQTGIDNLSLLTEDHEQALFTMLSRYPEVVELAAITHTPHLLAHFLMDLARDFHTYYNAHQFMTDDIDLSQARLTLITAVRQVIANGLGLMGVSAPQSM
ncbi:MULTISPECIES: arginine--tRNA ligase [unclassified Methylophaga]|uniref:arginine--tRNA ligase n=2 Tax=Methylophaga TaxID=40222 RepID=UPI000C3FF07C|nr:MULTISPECIES: arginine--tRNA ligase [unclassified Methylophaga]MAL50246.1 arginine--tRNA ligase [Methylophaga sp.]MAM29389.1 arginine--tRNA ligase [Flavobacteriaceae bacterium]MBP25534.1 arginine--tRNA ligase [Methylophaga sp.]